MRRGQISRENFLLAREYIVTDVRRELDLARVSENPVAAGELVRIGVRPGGGNFLAALAMLCYTEFAGGLITGGTDRAKFETFIRRMGGGYGELLDSGMNIYKLFRCGMAHEYFAKKSMEVSMFGNPPVGLGELRDGRLFFCLEKYLDDFVNAFDDLGQALGHL